MVQRILNKTLTAFIFAFAYILLLVHNLVPHYHEADIEAPAHHAAADHHHDHEQSHEGHENPGNPDPAADHFLSHHQHPFADNKIYHPEAQPAFKLTQKQVLPVLMCCLAFHHYLIRLPDKIPDPPAYLFPANNLPSRAHALRGPPVA